MAADDAAVRRLEARELARGASRLDAHERVAADELGAVVEAHDPAEAGLERRRRLVDVIAPEHERRLEPQCISRAEPAWLDTLGDELAPDRAAGFRRCSDLEAVFSGVAGARDEELVPHERQLGAGAMFERRDLRADDARQVAAGSRALNGEHHRLLLAVEQLDVHTGLYQRADLRGVAAGVRRVADDEEALRVEAVDVRVVDDTAVLVAEQGVMAAALGDLGDVVGDGAPQQALRIGADDEQAPHVRNIEDARALADGVVFFDDALVLHGHHPAGERHHTPALPLVQVEERGVAQRRGREFGHGSPHCTGGPVVGVGRYDRCERPCGAVAAATAPLTLRHAVRSICADRAAGFTRGCTTGSRITAAKSSSAATRLWRSKPQPRHRCTMACSPLARVNAPTGAMDPPQSLARSPGVLPSTWRE